MSEAEALARAQFERWGITPDQAVRAGLFVVDDAATVNADFARVPAIVIPYFGLDGEALRTPDGKPFCRARYLADPPAPAGFVLPGKPQRYVQPAASGVHAYFPPDLDLRGGAVITEGEAKALAATNAGIPTIGLGGVWNFADADTGELLPELVAIGWRGKSLTICFDSDAATNPQIQHAESRLAEAMLRQGATVKLARLPPRADGSKVGMDDYLLSDGAAALRARLAEAVPLGQLDAEVLALNKRVAWIQSERMLYDVTSAQWITRDSFVGGPTYGSISVPVARARGARAGRPRKNSGAVGISSDADKVFVAPLWLKSPLARKYDTALFRPGEGREVLDDMGNTALNLWTGWREAPGDVAPWLALTDFIFSQLPPELRDLPLKWLAYKAQNPAIKIPLALVIVGPEGTGKTLWAQIVRDAFAPHGHELDSGQLTSDFQGWLETSLLCVINEAQGDHVTFGSDKLKTLISDETRPMNEKFRPVRQVKSYASYILTSNRREVAAFAPDNRRMFCVSTPDVPRERQFYLDTVHWFRAGGARHVAWFLRHYDLAGWEPPSRAPLTAEKSMAYRESLTLIEQFAYDCLHEGGGIKVITRWLEVQKSWAEAALELKGQGAAQAAEFLRAWDTLQIRPWYTATELAMLLPQLAVPLYGNRKLQTTPAGEMSKQLRNAGIPYLLCRDDPRGFLLHGRREQFLILADFDQWREPISQDQFEKLMRAFPRYNQLPK